MNKIMIGDEVQVITGSDKGKIGSVLKIYKDYIFVKGVNIIKKHVKATKDNDGGIVEKENKIHISNVMLVCPDKKVPTRVGFTIDGSKSRLSKKSSKKIK